ncbi:acyl carrier protein [Erythrobacter sp.]|uniref:acyl carrier protein n=1 Tax=Erythrobacteraceae TaxID=335929 RepID=UPI001B04F054|nr:acyl carrier protein [Erythrobacter sp.]MBO6525458.1 acyl carrier protein [Erythrobacter sp.]MBO6529869.1 acyl carrier protein [Erythrobacter sp.]MBO6766878.1 acyl carrier protein [Erythrobacter sp.]
MTFEELRQIVIAEIETIAPDVAPVAIGDEEDLREALDLDSMDIFNLIVALHQRLDVEIPEADAGQFVTIGGATQWLVDHAGK